MVYYNVSSSLELNSPLKVHHFQFVTKLGVKDSLSRHHFNQIWEFSTQLCTLCPGIVRLSVVGQSDVSTINKMKTRCYYFAQWECRGQLTGHRSIVFCSLTFYLSHTHKPHTFISVVCRLQPQDISSTVKHLYHQVCCISLSLEHTPHIFTKPCALYPTLQKWRRAQCCRLARGWVGGWQIQRERER